MNIINSALGEKYYFFFNFFNTKTWDALNYTPVKEWAPAVFFLVKESTIFT